MKKIEIDLDKLNNILHYLETESTPRIIFRNMETGNSREEDGINLGKSYMAQYIKSRLHQLINDTELHI